jgi:hypothetical protein
MFVQDSQVRLRHGALADLATNALAGVDDVLQKLEWFEWYRICDVPEERLDEIQACGEANTGEPVYNLNNIYRLRIPMGLDVWAISQELEALPGIMLARPVPKPMPPPEPPDFVPNQGYLRPANSTPSGINAEYAWTQPGGNGTGVTVCDLEYSWNYNHTDITKAPPSQINPNPILDPFSDNNHGTAVIGELVSNNNSWGTTGICYGASLKTCGVTEVSKGYNVAGAIGYAIANLTAGDVILLEQQWDYYQQWDPDEGWIISRRYIPIEWWTSNYYNYPDYPDYQLQSENSVYVAIKAAIAVGINVVEAGGNGDVNTRELPWAGDSGAIIVGAGGNLERLSFPNLGEYSWGSSYGPRFNLQGWGANVTTTGYGYAYNSSGANYSYTNRFGGTSSASPIVAGAVAAVQGNRLALDLPILWPGEMRSLLNATGTRQRGDTTENIGPLPNLRQALPFSTSTPYRLTINVSVSAPPAETETLGGSVTFAPYGPWYDSLVPGLGQVYAPDTVVNLTATPFPGWAFLNWSGNVANLNSPSTTITMNGSYTVTANFVRQYNLTITSTAGGTVTTPGEGTFTYDQGTVVNLVATPTDGYRFVNWTGNVGTITSVNGANTITMNGDYSITANFEKVCFIATAAYGTPMADEIETLREFRDKYLLTNPVGRALVDVYYAVSPPVAEFITEHLNLKPIVRAGLLPAVVMSAMAVNTTPAEKAAIAGLVALVSVALAVWATRRRDRGPEYT